MDKCMNEEKSLYQMLIDAGYPESDMDHHGSDLYIYATPLTWRVLNEWRKQKGWNMDVMFKDNILFSTFTDLKTGRKMYDIAFQYAPFWDSEDE